MKYLPLTQTALQYEGDASPVRGDLYTYGNGYLSVVSQFEELYNRQAGVPDDQVLIRKVQCCTLEQSIPLLILILMLVPTLSCTKY